MRVSILDTSVLQQGERCFIQIHLNQELPFCPGDRFVLRDSSNERTSGRRHDSRSIARCTTVAAATG